MRLGIVDGCNGQRARPSRRPRQRSARSRAGVQVAPGGFRCACVGHRVVVDGRPTAQPRRTRRLPQHPRRRRHRGSVPGPSMWIRPTSVSGTCASSMKQTEALYANRHAAAQKFLSTWDWPAYVKHTDLSKTEDRALGRSQGRADRQDPCPDRHRDLPGRDVSPRADFSAHEHHLGARFAQQLGAVGDRNRVRSHPRRAARRQRGGHPSGP